MTLGTAALEVRLVRAVSELMRSQLTGQPFVVSVSSARLNFRS